MIAEVQGSDFVMGPIVQWGFAGFCGVLLLIIIWLIRRLLESNDASNKIVSANTLTVASLTEALKNQTSVFDIMYREFVRHNAVHPQGDKG